MEEARWAAASASPSPLCLKASRGAFSARTEAASRINLTEIVRTCLKVPVLASKNDRKITNVRHGETDPLRRHLEADFVALLSVW